MVCGQICFAQSPSGHQTLLSLVSYGSDERTAMPERSIAYLAAESREVDLPESPRPQPTDRVKSSSPYDSNRLLSPLGADNESDNDVIALYHIDVQALQSAYQRSLPHRVDPTDAASDVILTPDSSWRTERYHWSGLLKQSLFFNVIESTFRFADDDQIRYLILKKPFWHDYVASMRQYNMRRWNDGDNFLTNYVGHPMQGAVASFIEIQNDPTGRQQELSATHDYWMSRFKGFLWSTVYSTHSEISPFGEAGIGDQGGWTYPLKDCKRPCARYEPGMKYTNNTGWVDFIITPTVGSLWVLAEDTLDRYVSDRIQGDNRTRVFPKILRGTLNPSRTMANFLRLKKPWYRDFQHTATLDRSRSAGIHMLRSDEDREAASQLHRFAVAAYYRSAPFGTSTRPCAVCFTSNGFGTDFDYALNPWISATVAVDSQEGIAEKGSQLSGSTINTSFGMRLVRTLPQNTFSFAIRPGVAIEQISSVASGTTPPGIPARESQYSVQLPSLTLVVANDYKVNRNLSLRSAFGATIIRYRTAEKDPPGIGKSPYLSWLSHDIYTNHTTWIWQGGPVYRF
jgi:hypothetical protein